MTVTDSDGTNFFFSLPPPKLLGFPLCMQLQRQRWCAGSDNLVVKVKSSSWQRSWMSELFGEGCVGKFKRRSSPSFHLLHFLRRYLLKFSEWKFQVSPELFWWAALSIWVFLTLYFLILRAVRLTDVLAGWLCSSFNHLFTQIGYLKVK